MDIDVFKRVVELLKSTQEKDLAIYKLGIDLTNVNEGYHEIISHLIGAYYGPEGKETFEWWCYDKEFGARTDLAMTNSDGVELCQTIDDLHQYIEDTAAPFSYKLPRKMTEEERMNFMESIFPGIKN
jgi:hypothetical protein